jgi:hypothetical protein
MLRVVPRSLGLSAVVASLAAPVWANPRPLPFSYPHEQLPEGATEIEQYVDYTPVRALDVEGHSVPYAAMHFQTEFEHGITDRLELGLYVMYAPAPNGEIAFQTAPSIDHTGLKQRLRYKLADTGAWPIDVSLYGELVENEKEVELEGKVILQRRIGPMRIIANATVEEEFEFAGERNFVVAPSGGLTFEATPSVQPGIEWWMRAEYPADSPSPRPFELGPHHYVGPALLLQFGRLWWTNGVYLRVSDFGRALEPGDGAFGNVWLRSVVGLGFD